MRIIRFFLVLLGVVALLVAAMAVAAEVKSFADTGQLFAKPLGEIWAKAQIGSYQAFEVGIERHLGLTWLYQSVFLPLLERPPIAAAGAFAALGIVLLFLGRLFRGRR